MRAVLVAAVLASFSCSSSSKTTTCENARALYVADYQRKVDAALASPDVKAEALKRAAAVELKAVRERFVPRCEELAGDIYECVGRMVEAGRLTTAPPCSERLAAFFDGLYE